MKVELSNNFHAKVARIKRLPERMNLVVDGAIKKDLIGIINTFKEGIKNNSFGLQRLESITVLSKRRKGYPKPKTPLYGKGEAEERSYINMLKIRKLKNGQWRLFPSWARHWSGNIQLRELLIIHEKGALIRTKNGKLIRIPPRPAFLLAGNRYMRGKRKQETSQMVKQAITEWINTGKSNEMDILVAFANRAKEMEE